MEEKNLLDILNNDWSFQSEKRKRKIPAYFLKTKYFDELGYEEFYQLCDKFIEIFNNIKYKDFNKEELIRLAKLIGNRCSIEAEAEHEAEYQMKYYEKMKNISELGLRLSKTNEELLWNLGVANYFLEKYEEAISPFKHLLKIKSEERVNEEIINKDKTYSKVIRSTPLTYLNSICKKLNKSSKNKRILKKLKSFLNQYNKKL